MIITSNSMVLYPPGKVIFVNHDPTDGHLISRRLPDLMEFCYSHPNGFTDWTSKLNIVDLITVIETESTVSMKRIGSVIATSWGMLG